MAARIVNCRFLRRERIPLAEAETYPLITTTQSMQGLFTKIKVVAGNLPGHKFRFLGETKIQIYREAPWLWFLPRESCCFCARRTGFWSTKKNVPVCRKCANEYEESDVPTEEEWRSL